METFLPYLPYILPVIFLHYGMAIYVCIHVFRQKEVRSSYKIIWCIVALFIQIIGPILYFIFGKREH